MEQKAIYFFWAKKREAGEHFETSDDQGQQEILGFTQSQRKNKEVLIPTITKSYLKVLEL